MAAGDHVTISGFWAKVLAGVAIVALTTGAGAAVATYTGVQDLTRRVEALERQRGDGALEERLRAVELALRGVETKLEMLAGKP